MKKLKILFLFLGILCLSGCFDVVEDKPEVKEPNTEEKVKVKEVYQDSHPIKIGLYNNIGNKYVLYKEFNSNIKPRTDINTFQIVFRNEEEVSFNGKKEDFIKSSWDEIETPFTLGIILEYDTVNEGHIKHVIYDPSNTLEHDHYIQVYLYDAIAHKNDKWYSHITKEEFNDNSYVTSFKLYAHDKIDEVTFPIKLSVFTYDSDDDFDEDGNYRGNSIYTIEVTNS